MNIDPSLRQVLEDFADRCREMDAPLAERLRLFADAVREASPEFTAVVDQMVARLTSVGIGHHAPDVGEPMPEFVLPDQSGALVKLSDLTQRGSVVIAFHRGHWCPYCRINAAALTAIQGEVKSRNAQLVAITPEVERFNAELRSGADARYPVLSDIDNGYALLLGLAFYVGDEKREKMRAAGVDIAAFQAGDNWTLPVPATFVIGDNGKVKARFMDPDYRKRASVDEVLAAL